MGLIGKSIDFGLGAALLTAEKARELVDDLVKRGKVAKEDSEGVLSDLLSKGRQEREDIQKMVTNEIRTALSKMDIATAEDLRRLERRIAILEDKLYLLEQSQPTAEDTPLSP
ncbi:MAG: hypothetical protein IT210_08780 [Armatimonadetes bacterium]|nr:hypothetical protein [Armatimonadota bacterium]